MGKLQLLLLPLLALLSGCSGLVVNCPYPINFENGDVGLKYSGYMAYYKCHPGYKMQGYSRAICIRKTWSHPTPRCVSENPEVTVSPPTATSTIVPPLNNDIFSQHIRRRKKQYNALISAAKLLGRWQQAEKLQKKLNGIISSLELRRTNYYHEKYERERTRVKTTTPSYQVTTITPELNTAEVTDPCSVENGGCAHKCKVVHDEITCSCNNGYLLNPKDGKSCEDFNECESNFGRGPCSDKCTNFEGTFKCLCTRSGTQLASNNKTCQDIDECATNNHGCSHTCTNVYGSAYCSCPPGYILLGGGKTCEDINECELPSTKCFGECINVAGSYKCEEIVTTVAPTPGYTKDCYLRGLRRNQNGVCVDINECEDNNFQCSHTCINYYGGAFCACPRGFRKINSKTCEDINECNTYYGRLCSFGCTNTIGSYMCSCPPGFQRGYKQICRDIDECSTNNGGCSHTCVNWRGSMECRCPKGFELLPDKKTCRDINECLLRNPCHQRCINFDGGFKCACKPGNLLLYNDRCEPCRKNSYMLEGKDSCNECPPHSHTNGRGKTSLSDCLCNDGFKGNLANGELCTDIDECSVNNFNCSDRCVNTPGSAHCACPNGYKLDPDGKTCSDIDECAVGNGGCEHHCKNKIGSFECFCNDNYYQHEKDIRKCIDIDECEKDNGGCSHYCENLIGSYQCKCDGNMRLSANQKTCINIECPALPRPANSHILCDGLQKNKQTNLIVGISCSVKCNKGYELQGNAQLTCLGNGTWSNSVPYCAALTCPQLSKPSNGNVSPTSCHEEETPVTKRCYYTCNKGYILVGKPTKVCKRSQAWSPEEIPFCQKDIPEPFIQCPSDVEITLDPGNKAQDVKLARPITNMNPDDITVEPDWVNYSDVKFPSGMNEITYTARNPLSNQTASCILSVLIKDKERPEVDNCPENFEVEAGATRMVTVDWKEPIFTDNVGIERVWKSNAPGSEFGDGIHSIKYSAQDAAGNEIDCTFSVTIKRRTCPPLVGPKNGQQNCMDWLYGQICQPNCDKSYIWYDKRLRSSKSKAYACGADVVWKPSSIIPDCIEYRPMDNSSCLAGEESLSSHFGVVCVKCPLGMYSDYNSVCQDCPVSFYSDSVGSTSCTQCPIGFKTPSTGSSSHADCIVSNQINVTEGPSPL